MYTIPANAILEVQYRYKLQGQQLINVLHYRLNQEVTDGRGAAEEAAENVFNEVFVGIQTRQTTDVTNCEVRAQWVHPTRYAHVTWYPPALAGSSAPPTLSIGTSIVLKKLADLAGHSHRGRIFVGGAPVSDTEIGLITAASLPGWRTIAETMAVDVELPLAVAIVEPVIWSYADRLTNDEIVQGEVDQALRYQRRREVGRGE